MPDSTLELSIHVAAKPSTVYRFLSDPKLFQQWMGTSATLGANEVRVQYPSGETAWGLIRQAVPDERLVFGWGFENPLSGMAPDATVVTIALTATVDGATTVTLTHGGLTAQQRAMQSQGWDYYLNQLKTHAGSIGIAERLPSMVDAYCSAWNETNRVARRALLEQCWESDGMFRDSMGSADSLETLHSYIGNAQSFMPGLRLESDGKANLVHGFVRFPWVIRGPDGNVIMRGTNFGKLSEIGKFSFLVGFGDG